ncbi:MAG TPA: prefoldin subunit beta [Methanomassiliicoccales archaeon]|nr:prefoldin subunit beta [Methanomassiliicoccales archaeon]
MDNISPKLQNQIAQFQQLQQQLQNVLSQKFRMEAQQKELEMTIEELKKATQETPIYKNVGSLMIAVKDKDALLKEMEDDKETVEVRVKTLDRQEKMFREKYQVMQDQISKALGQAPVRAEEDEN